MKIKEYFKSTALFLNNLKKSNQNSNPTEAEEQRTKIEDFYKSVAVYFNKEHHIIISLETITSDFSSVVDSGKWYELNPPYNEEELTKLIKFALSQSFTEFSTWKPGERIITPIQKCLKKRSYKQAIIGYGLFEIDGVQNCYLITIFQHGLPTFKHDCTFRIGYDIGTMALQEVRFQPKSRFARAGAADHQHVFVPGVLGVRWAVAHH